MPRSRAYQIETTHNQIRIRSPISRRTLFVTSTFIDGVALSALSLEDLLSSLGIAGRCLAKRRHFGISSGKAQREIKIGFVFAWAVGLVRFFWEVSWNIREGKHVVSMALWRRTSPNCRRVAFLVVIDFANLNRPFMLNGLLAWADV